MGGQGLSAGQLDPTAVGFGLLRHGVFIEHLLCADIVEKSKLVPVPQWWDPVPQWWDRREVAAKDWADPRGEEPLAGVWAGTVALRWG